MPSCGAGAPGAHFASHGIQKYGWKQIGGDCCYFRPGRGKGGTLQKCKVSPLKCKMVRWQKSRFFPTMDYKEHQGRTCMLQIGADRGNAKAYLYAPNRGG